MSSKLRFVGHLGLDRSCFYPYQVSVIIKPNDVNIDTDPAEAVNTKIGQIIFEQLPQVFDRNSGRAFRFRVSRQPKVRKEYI